MRANYIGVMNESTWEEEAFAEDGRGPLGGFVWPPTSYSCGFCTKEFRSAQALGGHMNIHRRERARLRQSLNSTTIINPPLNPNSNSPNPSFSSSPSSRVSLTQRTLSCSNSDAKNTSSCAPSPDHGAVETNFILGFCLDSNTTNHHHHCGFGHDDNDDVLNCKRQKTTVMPLIVGSIEEVDLELRLAT